jgi:hypothetical protein
LLNKIRVPDDKGCIGEPVSEDVPKKLAQTTKVSQMLRIKSALAYFEG